MQVFWITLLMHNNYYHRHYLFLILYSVNHISYPHSVLEYYYKNIYLRLNKSFM